VADTYECLAVAQKHPDEAIGLVVNWADFLDPGDAIYTFAFTASGLTVGSITFDGDETVGVVSGGTAGTNYFARSVITTQAGLTDVRTIRVEVREC